METLTVPLGGQDLWIHTLLRLGLAALLGGVVAGSWWVAARHRERTPGFGGTLTLLALLISFVTMAVGSNTAVAFTLVGTLAIVRFRTSVRDIRDTAFVIFAVAAGIASGTLEPLVAGIGTVFVALVSLGISCLPGANTSSDKF